VKLVNLVSGGLDSTLVSVLVKEQGIDLLPLFVDYGQRAAQPEWDACRSVHHHHGLPKPVRMDVSGFAAVIRSGLTRQDLDVKRDAFTPGRNLMFLLMGAAYAYQTESSAVAIGLLSERTSLFPDQRAGFLEHAERALQMALGRGIKIVTPLFDFTKADVVALAKAKAITGTYSCHAGTRLPCGRCISCLEYRFDTGG
jgi:7-cyano-7-deazaguanine synthase